MKLKSVLAFLITVVLVAVLIHIFWPRRMERSFYSMGGIPVKVAAYGRNFIQFDRNYSAVEKKVAELVSVFNRYNKNSELSKINEKADAQPVVISSTMRELIELSFKWYNVSEKTFDPTVLPLLLLWENSAKSGELPSKGTIAFIRSYVGLGKVEFERDSIFFPVRGMKLDFGAVAKGFIVDEGVKILVDEGVDRGLIEAGGDSYAFGDGEFKFGIQDPFDKTKLLGTVQVGEGAVVTSGDYERYVEIEGKKYSHIIDPRTGMPVDTGIASVTIIGGSAASADAIATAVMVLGLEDGLDFLASKASDRSFVLVHGDKKNMKVYCSKDLRGKFTPSNASIRITERN